MSANELLFAFYILAMISFIIWFIVAAHRHYNAMQVHHHEWTTWQVLAFDVNTIYPDGNVVGIRFCKDSNCNEKQINTF